MGARITAADRLYAAGKPYCPYHAGIATSKTASSGQKGYFQLGARLRRADAAHKEGCVA